MPRCRASCQALFGTTCADAEGRNRCGSRAPAHEFRRPPCGLCSRGGPRGSAATKSKAPSVPTVTGREGDGVSFCAKKREIDERRDDGRTDRWPNCVRTRLDLLVPIGGTITKTYGSSYVPNSHSDDVPNTRLRWGWGEKN